MNSSGPPHEGHAAGDFDLPVDEVTCQQFVELITEYFEGALHTRTLRQVEEHLVMCDWCTAYLEQMQATIASLSELADESVPEPPDSVLAVLGGRRRGGA